MSEKHGSRLPWLLLISVVVIGARPVEQGLGYSAYRAGVGDSGDSEGVSDYACAQ